MEASAATNFVNPLSVVIPAFACLFSNLKERDGQQRTYDGFQVLRINASTDASFRILQRLFVRDNFDFWNPPSKNRATDVMICPEQVRNAKWLLKTLRIPYEVLIPNVKDSIVKEQHRLSVRESTGMTWDTYHRLEIINTWMDSLASKYDFVTVMEIGKSAEGRPMKLLRISTGGPSSRKPSIWMDGGIHAREWISPAVVTFMANELIQNTALNRNYSLVNLFDWYILPNVNPDGYEYSHTTARMWRKTRSKSEGFLANFFRCQGADPNRNFAYKWGGKGTSKNPCSDIYHGSEPASEVEIKSIQNFLMRPNLNKQFKLFLTFHSYSQMLFLPWGYDRVRTDDYEELMEVATKAAKALSSVYGTEYEVGPSPELLYAAAGGSEDFAKGVAKIKYSYCFELRDTGKDGFILPPNQIVPSGIETFAAVQSMAEDLKKIYNLDESPSPVPGNEELGETQPENPEGNQIEES